MKQSKSQQRLLNRNENTQGPSPEVLRAIREFDLKTAPFYLDGYYGSELADVLARRFALSRTQVSVGYGAEFFLRAIFDACTPGDVVLTCSPYFTFYSVYAKAKRIRLVASKLKEGGSQFEFDVADLLAKIKSVKPNVVLITSPNNPTGNTIAPKDLQKILRAAAKNTLVVFDNVYWGFDENDNERAFFSLLKRYGNLVILRTFSKRYALAGLRVGFALWGKRAKDVIAYQDLYLGGNRLLETAALAALKSESYYRKLSREVIADREMVISAVNRLPHFKAYESHANFIFIKVDAHVVSKLDKVLKRLPVAIAKWITVDDKHFMRVSLGSPKDTREFLAVLRNFES